MTAFDHLDIESNLVERPCPICGKGDRSRIRHEARIESERLDRFAFASRKRPDFMHHRLLLCERCDLLYASPVPAPSRLEGAYAGAAYDSAREARYAARTYRKLLDLAGGNPGVGRTGSALDIGAGDGAFVRELIAAGYGEAIGVEPSVAPVRAAAPMLRERIHLTSFEKLEVEPQSLDLVSCMATIEHLSDPLEVCRRARDLLRPGGYVLLTCHDRDGFLNRVAGRRSPIYDIEHLQLFSRGSVRALLDRAGFGRARISPFVNRYPLRYWLRMLSPSPRITAAFESPSRLSRVGDVAISLPVGNLGALARRVE